MDDIIVNTHEAKSTLSQLLKKVEQGHNVIIARAGKPIGKLTALEEEKPKKRNFGNLKGKIIFHEGWEETPQDIIDAALNNPVFPTEDNPSK